MLLVTASESSKRQTEFLLEIVRRCGVIDLFYPLSATQSPMKRGTLECDSHVEVTEKDYRGILSSAYWILGMNMRGINPQP